MFESRTAYQSFSSKIKTLQKCRVFFYLEFTEVFKEHLTSSQFRYSGTDYIRVFSDPFSPLRLRELAGHSRVNIINLSKIHCQMATATSTFIFRFIENTNGLIRQYIPKKRHFSTVKDEEIGRIMHKLNHRPRKRLAFISPLHAVSKEIANVAFRS